MNRPFRLLARFYDELVAGTPAMNRHVRGKLLARFWPEIRSVMELACGNGTAAIELAGRGLDVAALDLSPTFVREARKRVRAAGVRVRVAQGDMRSFRVRAPVDLVLCEFAAVNHLDRRSDLGRFLRCAARALRPGGFLLFDLDTPVGFAKRANATYFFESPRFKVVMRSTPAKDGPRARADLDWFLPERGRFRHVREQYGLVSWTEPELRAALRAAGFTGIRTFDGIDVRPRMPGAERGTDLHLLARRGSRR